MYGKCGRCEHGDRYADGWCKRFASKPDDIGGDCEGDCPYFNTTVSVPVEQRVIKPCPFKDVEKEMGHEPYTMEDELWHVQCTCGARGPISPTADYAIKSWNKMAL